MTAGRLRRQGRMTHQNPSGAADTLRFLPPDGDPLGFFGFSGMRQTGAGTVFRTSPSSAIGPSASITSAPFSRAPGHELRRGDQRAARHGERLAGRGALRPLGGALPGRPHAVVAEALADLLRLADGLHREDDLGAEQCQQRVRLGPRVAAPRLQKLDVGLATPIWTIPGGTAPLP